MRELDRPIWHALTTRQREFAQGSELALRFDPGVSPFAACRDNRPASLAALAGMVPEAGMLVLLQADDAPVPPGCEPALVARGVQMLLERFRPVKLEHAALDLGASDTGDMVELASLTRPGPFLPGTPRFGGFVGIRVDGRLAAMAGERLRLGGWTEVSAVCAHSDFRGQGMAAQLSSLVVERILARGERPFLHAFADNDQAIRLYEQLGFAKRRDVNVLALARAGHRAEALALPHVH
jgi:ribosomal protein S18 acetylase RimI-like enzyme